MKIKIDHIAKIEGHAGFTAEIIEGNVSQARLRVLEGARLLEGILRGRKYQEVSQICARICGVCPVVHNLTSLKAIEKALGVKVDEVIILLRKIIMLGQIINSHALHIFFFSLSDFFGIKEDLKLIKKYPQKTKQAIAIRNFGNEVIEIIGGRAIHPLTPTVGGFTKLPDLSKLKKIKEEAEKVLPEAIKLAKFFAKLKCLDFVRKTEFITLFNKKEYPIYDGNISISNRREAEISDFVQLVKETQIAEDAVKRTAYEEKPYMVGAIARVNNNHRKLNQEAKKILKLSKIKLPSYNPFHNILAQAIEIVHCLEEAIKLSNQTIRLLKVARNTKQTDVPTTEKGNTITLTNNKPGNNIQNTTGVGTSAIEAPRGTLFYFYEVGDDGLIKNCNIITPTAQNLARLEKDLEIWLPQLEKQKVKQEQIKDKIKMLIRAYDPCLTCATH